MDFDFDDSFDQFLSDNSNILFKKLEKPPSRHPSGESSSSSVIFLEETEIVTTQSKVQTKAPERPPLITLPVTPPKPSLSVPVAPKTIGKSRLIPGSVKKNHKLPGTKKASSNLFRALPVASKPAEVLPKPTALQQKDAVKHIVVHMSEHVKELLGEELSKMDPERRFNHTHFEQNPKEIFFAPYLYWKPMPKLKELLDNGQYVTNYNAPYFNQIMVFLSPQTLHKNVHVYVKKELQNQEYIEDSFVDILDVIKKISTDLNGSSQVTMVIYGLDEYLKKQKNKANQQFRRQMMNQMMTDKDSAGGGAGGGQRKKKKDVPAEEETDGLIELTIENIDMFLIDLSMRFLHDFGGIGTGNLTPIIPDSTAEIVELIFRYSRSLSEQLFRNDRRGDAGSEVYMMKNKVAAMELEEARGRGDVEKIWLKQLQQMPSMKAATSKAIVEHFPTPFSLWSRLQNSTNPVGLLSKIGQGTAGKVGVDLAEKIHLFMTGDHPNEVLKTATSART